MLENRLKLKKWGQEVCGPHMVDSDTYQKVLSRLGNTGEAIYTIMMGICRVYDLMKNKSNKWNFEITDSMKIPRIYLTPDMLLISESVGDLRISWRRLLLLDFIILILSYRFRITR